MTEAKDIYRRMLAVFEEKCGAAAADSADLAVRLYAAAAELESLYGYCDWAVNQSFPQTAVGQHLDLHAKLRGLSRKGAAKASGTVVFYLEEAAPAATAISAGTVVMTAGGVRAVTAEDAVIEAGSLSCSVSATAAEAGKRGNVAAGSLCRMPLPPVGVVRCSNPAPFTGGTDGEDDEALRKRVLESFSRLPNGANAAFYEQRALAIDGVKQAAVLPRRRGSGTVDVVVDAEREEILQQAERELAAVREIAVDVKVFAPEEVPVDVSVTLWPAEDTDGESAIRAAEEAVREFFRGKLLGKTLYLAELGSRIFATGAVRNYTVTAPKADITIAAGQMPVLGTLSVTEGE